MAAPTILEELHEAQRHVRQGAVRIQNQQTLIADLDRHGHDATDARSLLYQMEETQKLHVADRDRLLHEISKPH